MGRSDANSRTTEAADRRTAVSMVSRARSLGAGVQQLFIDGAWRDPADPVVWQHVHPASNEEDFGVVAASDEEVDRAVRAARRAFDEGPWPKLGARERKLLLSPIGDLIRRHADQLHKLQLVDNGVPITTVSQYRFSAHIAADLFEYHAGWIDKLGGDSPPVFTDAAPAQVLTTKEPLGVVAAITPFNAPVMQFAQKVAPALAAGCTVVLKPSEYASNVAALFTRLIEQLELPPGVFNLVTGPASIGAALINHPSIDKVAFTGRREVGEEILGRAAHGMKRVTLELGGKSPSIVFDDVADVAATGRYLMGGVSMDLSGQHCLVQTRAVVQEKIYDEFLEAAAQQLRDVRYGDPFDPATTSAPLITKSATERVLRLIEGATEDGARLLAGGNKTSGLGDGNWIDPTLFADVDNTMTIAREEIFGPVLCVIPFKDEEDAIRIANDTDYGLSAGVYTSSPSRALRVARAIRSGTVGINGLVMGTPAAPFGGYKTSGLGREGGREGIEEYLETKTITIPLTS